MEGERIDKALSELLPEYTRSSIQAWIKQQKVLIDNTIVNQKYRLKNKEVIEIHIPPAKEVQLQAENIKLEIVYEDEHVIVINKPSGLVVHPGAGNQSATLMNGLLYHDAQLRQLPRAGIVHRLDKDTTGLMVVAKNEAARQGLISQLESRQMNRQYLAITNGVMISGETIDQPIGRHHVNRLKMAVTKNGKPAVTHIRVLQKFDSHCLLQANLETGRTHQIRVHLAWRGFPLVGDPLYGKRLHLPASCSEPLSLCLRNFNRQALHAQKIDFLHPYSQEPISFTVDADQDMQKLLALLGAD